MASRGSTASPSLRGPQQATACTAFDGRRPGGDIGKTGGKRRREPFVPAAHPIVSGRSYVGSHPSQSQPSSAPAGAAGDAALVAAAVTGDRQAFAALVERHQARILTLLERLTGCQHQARDLAQETFVSAYRNLATFEQRSAFSTWLHRIACNHAAAAGRRRRPVASLDAPSAAGRPAFAPAANVADVSARLEQEDLARQVAAALRRLDGRYREVVVLSDMQGASYEEIAATLDIPLGTVRSRLHRGRLELRLLLAPVDRGMP